ncbi:MULTISPECIES: hypothetical protein [Nocardiopsis]|uniref:hypothetical protein n=1 Tax=Nocardiopsis TaxID=2013 RepID=UPI001EF9D4FB|nr:MULTISPECIES: hypothetical protein [Nocardiopsis]
MKPLITAGLAAGALALGAAPAAAEDSIAVSPAAVSPGGSVTLKSSCEGPAERLEFTSTAFSGTAAAELSNTFGSATVTVEEDARPGAYRVRGTCTGDGATGKEKVEGTITVTGGAAPTPSGAPQTGGGGAAGPARGPAAAAIGVLCALALLGAAVHRRLGRDAG